MAKENDKPMTREEVRQSALEDKFFQQLFGANALKKDPFKFGQVGMSAGAQNYADFMESEKADKIRKDIYAQRLLSRRSLKLISFSKVSCAVS